MMSVDKGWKELVTCWKHFEHDWKSVDNGWKELVTCWKHFEHDWKSVDSSWKDFDTLAEEVEKSLVHKIFKIFLKDDSKLNTFAR